MRGAGGGVRWFSAGTEGYQSWLREFKGGTMQNLPPLRGDH